MSDQLCELNRDYLNTLNCDSHLHQIFIAVAIFALSIVFAQASADTKTPNNLTPIDDDLEAAESNYYRHKPRGRNYYHQQKRYQPVYGELHTKRCEVIEFGHLNF